MNLLANAVSSNDNLEFLEDVVPKTQPYKAIRQKAAETRARINGDATTGEKQDGGQEAPATNGKKQKLLVNGGTGMLDAGSLGREEDANAQLELEASQAGGEDVVMKE